MVTITTVVAPQDCRLESADPHIVVMATGRSLSGEGRRERKVCLRLITCIQTHRFARMKSLTCTPSDLSFSLSKSIYLQKTPTVIRKVFSCLCLTNTPYTSYSSTVYTSSRQNINNYITSGEIHTYKPLSLTALLFFTLVLRNGKLRY